MDDDDYSIEIITTKRQHYDEDNLCSDELYSSKKLKSIDAILYHLSIKRWSF